MKRFRIIAIALALLIGFSGCEDWLELSPENAQTIDQYWESKEDVEAVLMSGYIKLRESVDEIFVWGEIRGDGISISNLTKGEMEDAEKVRNMDILPTNHYAKWDKMYKIINMANSVIKYGPEVVQRDDSFNEAEMNSYLSEAYFLRSLAYFYLVRTFRDVPLITEPLVRDDTEYEKAKSEAGVILDFIEEDLKKALPASKEYFAEVDDEYPMNTKGRATRWAINALLADIYLWQGNYDQCIEACDEVINSGRVGLIRNWFSNYYPGNTNESIFEIQYAYRLDQTNDFDSWFFASPRYRLSLASYIRFFQTEELDDIRGENGSYVSENDLRIWKYIGMDTYDESTAERSSQEWDQNFIIYRLADLLLMKAEALVMNGDYEEATEIIGRIRERAGIEEELNAFDNEFDMLDLVMEERAREFVAEGKRWFDLLRVGQRNDYEYMNYLIQNVTNVISLNNIDIVTSKLMDPDSHYMPIHQDELNSNPLLEQNPYYSGLGN